MGYSLIIGPVFGPFPAETAMTYSTRQTMTCLNQCPIPIEDTGLLVVGSNSRAPDKLLSKG